VNAPPTWGTQAILFAPPTLTLKLYPPETDLSRFNQLSARLLNHTTGSLLVGMRLVHGSESSSSGTTDESLSGGREELRPGNGLT